MDLRAKRTRTGGVGFTLVEMLVVVAILTILIGLAVGAGGMFRRDARKKQVKALLDAVQAIATEYKAVTGLVINHSNTPLGSAATAEPFDWTDPRLTNVGPESGWEPGSLATDWDQALADKWAQDPRQEPATGTPEMLQQYVAIERFVWAAYQVPRCREMLEQLRPGLKDTDGDKFLEIVDPWDKPLQYAAFVDHPSLIDTSDTGDAIDMDDHLPESNQPFFAWIGFDGKWGDARFRQEFGDDEAAYQLYIQPPTEEDKDKDWTKPRPFDAQDNLYSLSPE